MPELKPSNPKDIMGIMKGYLSVVPMGVIYELGLAMLEGALKYGRHNYRKVGIRASVYYDAAQRHMNSFWEGENTDPDSGLSHVTKAIASLVVLRDGMLMGLWEDDRPPPYPQGWMKQINDHAKRLIEKYPEPAEAITADKVSRDPCDPGYVYKGNPCQACHLSQHIFNENKWSRCSHCPRTDVV